MKTKLNLNNDEHIITLELTSEEVKDIIYSIVFEIDNFGDMETDTTGLLKGLGAILERAEARLEKLA